MVLMIGQNSCTSSSRSSSTRPSLLKCLKPICLVAKLLGVFPFKIIIDSNSTSPTFCYLILQHSWISKETIYSIIFLLGLIGTSILYVPFIFYTKTQINNNSGRTGGDDNDYNNITTTPSTIILNPFASLDFMTDLIFLIGQWLTGIITLLQIHYMSPEFVAIWNKCQSLLNKLSQMESTITTSATTSSMSVNHDDHDPRLAPKQRYHVYMIYRRISFTTFLFLIGWLCLYIGYTITYLIYFWPYFRTYFNHSYLVLYLCGFPILFLQVIGHLLHTIILCAFIRILERMYCIIGGLAEVYIQDFQSYTSLYGLYSSINSLGRRLGANYAFYIIEQVFIIIMTILTNFYVLAFPRPPIPACNDKRDNFGHTIGYSYVLPPIIILCCAGCMIIWCNIGQRFQESAKLAAKSISESAIINLTEEVNQKVTAFQFRLAKHQVRLTAGGFFYVDRGLLADISVLMTTYMIFLIQVNLF